MLCFPLNHLISFCQSSSYDLRRSLEILCYNFNLTLTMKCETRQDSTFSDLKFSGYPSGVSRANDDVLLPLICAQYYTYNLYPHECLLQKLYCLYRTIIAKYPLCKLVQMYPCLRILRRKISPPNISCLLSRQLDKQVDKTFIIVILCKISWHAVSQKRQSWRAKLLKLILLQKRYYLMISKKQREKKRKDMCDKVKLGKNFMQVKEAKVQDFAILFLPLSWLHH